MTTQLIADLLFVLIGVFIIWRCASNGFIKCLFKFVRTILALVLAYLLVAPVAPLIAENFIEEPVYNAVFEKVDEIYANAEESVDVDSLMEKLPDVLKTEDLEEKLADIDASGEALVEEVSATISAPLVTISSSVIAFVLLFLLLFILLSIAMAILNSLIERIKLIHLVNTLLGLAWGALVALILWTIVSALLKVLLGGMPLYEESVVIKFFAEADLLNNLGIIDFAEDLLASFF